MTAIHYENSDGTNDTPVSVANPLPVTGTITASSATQADPGSDATKATAVQGVTGGKAVKVDGSAVTQPVSGTVGLSLNTTGTQSNVASSASAVTILASNATRQGATVFNDSTAVLYLILSSTTPTTSVYTTQVAPNWYYEVPFRYTGIIKGIWASANGNARVTEITP